jgi:hypothetical protein
MLGGRMNRKEWRSIARAHAKSARVLLDDGNYSVAYHLAGMALECALKAVICRSFFKDTWPDKQFVNAIHSHDIAALVGHANLEGDRKVLEKSSATFRAHWATVQSWKVESRYKQWSHAEARDMVIAVTKNKIGILAWIRKHW